MVKIWWSQIFLLAERMNWKNANLISLSILFVMQSVCVGARRRLSESCKWPLSFAEVQISSTTFYCTVLYCKLWTQAIASKSTSKFSHVFYTTIVRKCDFATYFWYPRNADISARSGLQFHVPHDSHTLEIPLNRFWSCPNSAVCR